ncbi:MAG: hypothetical protein HY881_15230 [Deltaproteobacteria bacterium]|nr:hypothetical protein [Deltaproteobacteria bacterium]
MRRTIIGDFPDASSAEGFLKENNPAGNWPYLFCYRLEPMSEYRGDYSYPVTIFDRNGNMHGGYDNNKFDCFPGRMEADCRFKLGNIVQFGHHKLVLGVVRALPPDPAFVAQMGGVSGMLDAADDSYLVLYGKGGKDHDHLHECELFAPDAPIPRYLTVLQQTVLAGNRRKSPPVKEFYQKKLFFKWLENNKQLFSHEPYFAEEDDFSFSMRFNGITENISCCFIEKGDIVILAYYRNEVYDIVMDLDLYEEQTPDGRFQCSMCLRDGPCGKNPQNALGV